MSNYLSRVAALLALALLMLLAGSCADPQAQEKAAIRQLMRDYHAAAQDQKGEWAVSLVTPASLTHYTEVVKLALDGTEAQVRTRTAFDRTEIILIRTLAKRKDIKGMDGRAYQKWATEQGWYVSDEDLYSDWTEGMSDIRIDSSGDAAWCYIREGRKPTRFMLRFAKVNGKWLFDETSVHEYFNHWTAQEAKDLGMSHDQFLVLWLEDFYGFEVDVKNIWKPMK